MNKSIIVTGGAGFIGFHLSRRLLDDGYNVISLDNLNDYYDPNLKKDRLAILSGWENFEFFEVDISDRGKLEDVYRRKSVGADVPVVHLAAQAGVRYALKNPDSYIKSNLIGFYNLIDMARLTGCRHFLFASSSSVYGGNTKLPFSIHDNVDHPVSLYAATKKSNELLAHVYAYTYNLPVTGLRFFTVYGPWGRPDMAYFVFTKSIVEGKTMPVYNSGDMFRDFTYVDDVIDGIMRLMEHYPVPDPDWDGNHPDPSSSWTPYRIYNIGNHQSVNLMDFIHIIEKCLGKKADIEFQPMQVGDVKATYADIDDIQREVGFEPKTSIEVGMPKFVDWFLDYYKHKK